MGLNEGGHLSNLSPKQKRDTPKGVSLSGYYKAY